MSGYPEPEGNGSLLLAFKSQKNSILVIGSNTVAATRIFSALDADYSVFLLDASGANPCSEIQHRIDKGQIDRLAWDQLFTSDLTLTDVVVKLLHEHQNISLVCVADTSIKEGPGRRSSESAKQISEACQRCRVPVNITDMPDLCTFTFPTSHRFSDPHTGRMTPLQLSVTTNGKGCRLGGRLKRELISKLPKSAGAAVVKVGQLRELAQNLDDDDEFHQESTSTFLHASSSLSPNEPVISSTSSASHTEKARRRMRWVAQISEFWQIERLASLSPNEMNALLHEKHRNSLNDIVNTSPHPESHHGLDIRSPDCGSRGKIYLVGSGVGHPSLLTVAANELLSRTATLVLSDKLVPSAILDLVPKDVKVVIARKFPGNADEAQNELMNLAVDGALKGEVVVRLKQGDPMVYGRAGEEILYFRKRGFEAITIPGLTSAITGPALANIAVTQRGVAESFIVCTGVGREGKSVQLPGYHRERTTVILMGVARLGQIIQALTEENPTRRSGAPYPRCLPMAIIERASMPDQRVVSSTIGGIVSAFESLGPQRPPGMIVVGWAVSALASVGFTDVLDNGSQEADKVRVNAWLEGQVYRGIEGLSRELELQ